jgi:hypothetical protein
VKGINVAPRFSALSKQAWDFHMGSARHLFSADYPVEESLRIREVAGMTRWLLIFGFAMALAAPGCKNEGGSGDGIILARGGADSTSAVIVSDGRLSRKDNTNGNYKGIGTNGVPYSGNDYVCGAFTFHGVQFCANG